MDTEDFEETEPCEECEWHQQQIEHFMVKVREAQSEDFRQVVEGTGEPLRSNHAKRLLDAAVQAQLLHQRSHDLVEPESD